MSYNLTHHDPIPHMHHSYSHDPKSNDKALDSAVRQLFELYLPEKVEGSDHQAPRPQRYSSSTPANDAHYAEIFAGGANQHHHLRPRDSLMMRGGNGAARNMLPTTRPAQAQQAHRQGAMTTPWLGNDRETEYVQAVSMVQAKKEHNTLKMNPGARPSIQAPILMDQGFNQPGKDAQVYRQSLQAPPYPMMHRQASPPPPFAPAPHPFNYRPPSNSNSTGYPHPPPPPPPHGAVQIEYKHLRPIEDEPDFHYDANQVTRGQETIVRRTRPDVNPLSPIRPQKLPWGGSGPPQMMNPMSTQFHLEQHRMSPSNSTSSSNNTTFPDLDWSKQFASVAGDQIPLPPSETRSRKHPPRHVRFHDVVTVISAEQASVSGNNHRGGSGGRQGRTITPMATEPFASSRARDLSEIGMGVDLGYAGAEGEEYEEEEEEEEEEVETTGDEKREADEEDPESQEECVVVPPVFIDAIEDQVDGVLKYKEQHGIPMTRSSTDVMRTSTDVMRDEAMAAGASTGDDKAGSKFGRLKNIGKRWFL